MIWFKLKGLNALQPLQEKLFVYLQQDLKKNLFNQKVKIKRRFNNPKKSPARESKREKKEKWKSSDRCDNKFLWINQQKHQASQCFEIYDAEFEFPILLLTIEPPYLHNLFFAFLIFLLLRSWFRLTFFHTTCIWRFLKHKACKRYVHIPFQLDFRKLCCKNYKFIEAYTFK